MLGNPAKDTGVLVAWCPFAVKVCPTDCLVAIDAEVPHPCGDKTFVSISAETVWMVEVKR